MKKIILTIVILLILVVIAFMVTRSIAPASVVQHIASEHGGATEVEQCTIAGESYYRASMAFQGPDSIGAYFYDSKGTVIGYSGGFTGGEGRMIDPSAPCVTVYTKK